MSANRIHLRNLYRATRLTVADPKLGERPETWAEWRTRTGA
jgi:hypothetical protein